MKKALKRSLSLLLAITIIMGSAYVGLAEVDFGSLFAVEVKAATQSGYVKYDGELCGNDIYNKEYLFVSGCNGFYNDGNVYVYHNGIYCPLSIEVTPREKLTNPSIFEMFYYYNYVWISYSYSNKRYYWVPNDVLKSSQGGYWSTKKPSKGNTMYVKADSVTKRAEKSIYSGPYYIYENASNINVMTAQTNKKITIVNIDDQSSFAGKSFLLNGSDIKIEDKAIYVASDLFQTDNTLAIKNTASEFYSSKIKKIFLDDYEETVFFERRKSDTKPYINYLYCKSNVSGSKWKNAFFEDVTVTSTSTESFNIEMGATAQSGSISKYYLAQDGSKTIESATGSFSNKVIANWFKPDKPIVAYCVDSKGRTSRA